MKLNKIIEGWKNHIAPDKYLKDVISRVSKRRLSICKECEQHSSKHSSLRVDEHCVECGCSLMPKTKCLSCECPLSKWKAEITKDEQKNIEDEKDV